jgi:hypothetical protein
LNRFHQFVGNLQHFAWTNPHLRSGRSRLPGKEADGELPAEHLIEATSAPPLPARR